MASKPGDIPEVTEVSQAMGRMDVSASKEVVGGGGGASAGGAVAATPAVNNNTNTNTASTGAHTQKGQNGNTRTGQPQGGARQPQKQQQQQQMQQAMYVQPQPVYLQAATGARGPPNGMAPQHMQYVRVAGGFPPQQQQQQQYYARVAAAPGMVLVKPGVVAPTYVAPVQMMAHAPGAHQQQQQQQQQQPMAKSVEQAGGGGGGGVSPTQAGHKTKDESKGDANGTTAAVAPGAAVAVAPLVVDGEAKSVNAPAAFKPLASPTGDGFASGYYNMALRGGMGMPGPGRGGRGRGGPNYRGRGRGGAGGQNGGRGGGNMAAPLPNMMRSSSAPTTNGSQNGNNGNGGPLSPQGNNNTGAMTPEIEYFIPYQRPNPWYSLDVECVATGKQHNQRAVAQVSLVDQWERVLLNFYVKPKEKVFSYLTELTGLTEELVDGGVDLPTAVYMVKSVLPTDALLVGQNILADVEWLQLQEGRDFAGMLDLNGIWRAYNEKYKSYTYFSLHHQAKALLGIVQELPHNAATDAILSVRLFNLYKLLENDEEELQRARQALLTTPLEPSFAKSNPTCDGVCMGNKKTCQCGAPFFF